jgi:hypothetical protein
LIEAFMPEVSTLDWMLEPNACMSHASASFFFVSKE